MDNDGLLASAYHQLPHGDSLKVIRSIQFFDASILVCEAACTANSPLIEDTTGASAFVCIEFAAQAAAIHAILTGVTYDPARPAFIGAIKDLRISDLKVMPEELVRVECTQEFSADSGAIYKFEATRDSRLIAAGRLTLKK